MKLTIDIPLEFHKYFRAWVRLEPRCRSNDFAHGLEVRTADPLWLLTRQWQTGEFLGEDAGSPLIVHINHSTQPIDRVRLGQSDQFEDFADAPLEVLVEREKLPLDWRARVQIGQQFERFVRAEPGINASELIGVYRAAYSLVVPPQDEWQLIDRATRRFIEFMAGLVIDGEKLLEAIDERALERLGGITEEQLESITKKLTNWYGRLYSQPVAGKPEAWRNQQLDYRFEISSSTDIQQINKTQAELEKLVIALVDETLSSEERATIETDVKAALDQLIQSSRDTTRLLAPDYRNGALDWYTFDVASGLGNEQGAWVPQAENTTHPTRISVAGLSPRWWAFEDANVDFGRLDVAKPNLAKLLLMEFILIYGDDWYSVPLPVKLGSLVRIDEMWVKNVFGEELLIDPARKKVRKCIRDAGGDPDDPISRWELFTLSPNAYLSRSGEEEKDQDLIDVLLVPPVAGYREESPPLEEIRFLRDEGANKVWGVEHIVQNGLGRPVDGFDAQQEHNEIAQLEAVLEWIKFQLVSADLTDSRREELVVLEQDTRTRLRALREGSRTGAGPVPRYRLATTVPENWFPFVPATASHIAEFSPSSMRLWRAQMPRSEAAEKHQPITAMTRLLGLSEEPLLWLEEATVPRSGLRAQLTAQRIRWVDGKTYVWYGRKVLTGRGEGSSGLVFDRTIKRPRPMSNTRVK